MRILLFDLKVNLIKGLNVLSLVMLFYDIALAIVLDKSA